MGGQVSTIKAAVAAGGDRKHKRGGGGCGAGGGRDKVKIAILAFEVANVMSKCIVLWQSLSEHEILRLRTEVIKAEGVLRLVSDSEAVLLSLACREKLQDLMALAGSVARLGKKCQNPALQGFEHVFNDILKQNIDLSDFEFSSKEMENKMKKMERYIASTSNLYQELEILADLEQAVRRIQDEEDAAQRDSLGALEQKISWQRQEIKYLRDLSLWNRTYDKIVLLLAKTICTMHGRIVFAFGPPAFDLATTDRHVAAFRKNGELSVSCSSISRFSHQMVAHQQQHHHQHHGSFLQFCNGNSGSNGSSQASPNFVDVCNALSLGPSLSSSSPSSDAEAASQTSPSRMSADITTMATVKGSVPAKDLSGANGFHQQQNGCHQQQNGHHQEQPQQQQVQLQDQQQNGGPLKLQRQQEAEQQRLVVAHQNGRLNRLFFDPKFIHHSAPSSTLGGSALALHYANVIIIVEKMVKFPQLVGDDARDDLYRMLPRNVRLGLRSRLRACFKGAAAAAAAAAPESLVRVESNTASAWREKLDHVLSWLAPLAHNMVRWQSEHNFEQQVVSRTNVLLLQTLYFADQLKAEAAIVELLVGLNYLCWYEKETKANMPLEYAAATATSKDLDEYLDWQF